jgi:DNA-binding NarL/FixJ family response regulator
VRVLLVEDFDLVREALRCLLTTLPDVEVVGEAGDGNEALRAIARLRPDVVLMDLTMPRLNGVEAIRRAVKLRPRPRILVLSVHAEKEYVHAALAGGAAGYVLKTAKRDELALALAAVARGDSWISPSAAKLVIDNLAGHAPSDETAQLTARQREVLQLIAEGHTTKDVARQLHVSVKTVETHRAQIMQRLGIHHVAGLVRYAINARIVSVEK